MTASTTPPRPRILRETSFAFLVATAAAAGLYRVAFLAPYYSAILAAILLYVPAWVLRGRHLGDYGLRLGPLARGLRLAGLAIVLLLPPFVLGYLAWQRLACAAPWLGSLRLGPCGALGFHLRLPEGFVELAAAQLLVVALPEELFFRGYLQGRLAELWPRPQLLGAPLWPVVVAALAFALCHVVVQGNGATAAVFFPGLAFGWLRARTGSILASTLFHGACNLYIEILNRSFFG